MTRAPAKAHQHQSRPVPRFWTVRGHITGSQSLGLAIVGLVVPLFCWWAATYFGDTDKIFLPAPGDVVVRAIEWWKTGNLAGDIGISVGRVLGGFFLSTLIALPLGLLIGTYRPVQAILEPLTDFIRYMPSVAFIPLIMLWIGIDETAKVAIIFIGTFFQMVLMVAEDVRRVPMAQIEAAQTMGANRIELLEKVIFASAKPALLDTLRITMGWAWTYLVVAELVAANSGIGYAILKAQRFLQTDKIFVGIFLIGVIGLCTDQAFRWLHRWAFPWLYLKG